MTPSRARASAACDTTAPRYPLPVPVPSVLILAHLSSTPCSATYPAHPRLSATHPLPYVTPAHAYCRTSFITAHIFLPLHLSRLLAFSALCRATLFSAIIDNRKEEVINSRRRTIFWLFWFSCCLCSEHDCITFHLVLSSLSYHSNTVSRTPSSYFSASLPNRPPAHCRIVFCYTSFLPHCLFGLFLR